MGPASLTGTVQTGGMSGGVSEIVTLSALQSVSGLNVLVTIPLVQQSIATTNVTTIGGSCQSGFDCVDFTMAVPAVNTFVGTFSGAGTIYNQGNGPVNYNVDGEPVPISDATPVCGQIETKTGTVAVKPGNSFPVGTLSFTGCS